MEPVADLDQTQLILGGSPVQRKYHINNCCLLTIKFVNRFFSCTMNLQVGTYQYKFIVDGKWTYDHMQNSLSDGFGSYNNILEVIPRLVVYDETEESEEDERILKQLEENGNKGDVDNWDYGRIIKISSTLDSPDIKVRNYLLIFLLEYYFTDKRFMGWLVRRY